MLPSLHMAKITAHGWREADVKPITRSITIPQRPLTSKRQEGIVLFRMHACPVFRRRTPHFERGSCLMNGGTMNGFNAHEVDIFP